ncbi:MAG: M56 family metallopeptidase [Balneola sp.]
MEKEKRLIFNRAFLIWSLVFSLIIPLTPVGIISIEIPWSAIFQFGEATPLTGYQNFEEITLPSEVVANAIVQEGVLDSNTSPDKIFFLIYGIVSALLFIRLIRTIVKIHLKSETNRKCLIQGFQVVLLNENVIPHSFINTVFLNKKEFKSGKIPEEVLNHEFTHIRQKHSLDILFVEVLKIVFWFNPMLYLYKKAIALNHEYLADEAVLSNGTIVKNYQQMLLKTLEISTTYSLASSFNFLLTKRRLQMMTQSKKKVQFPVKMMLLAPFFALLSMVLGCEPEPNKILSDADLGKEVKIEIRADNNLLVNGQAMTLDELETALIDLSESPELVRMNVSEDAEFGAVTDVQNVLRRQKAYRIIYNHQKSDSSVVLTLPPATNEEKTSLESQNVMRILMNSQALILMNSEPAQLNEVKKNVKEFLDAGSRDPSKVVFGIKTSPEASYELYLELLEEIRSAINELRDEAAVNKFGSTFSNLAEESPEREMVRKIYPMKLSTTPPSKKE